MFAEPRDCSEVNNSPFPVGGKEVTTQLIRNVLQASLPDSLSSKLPTFSLYRSPEPKGNSSVTLSHASGSFMCQLDFRTSICAH